MPTLLFIAVASVMGLLLGSFANVLITRLPKRESIAFPGSHCRSCGTALRPWHNIPLLSWAMLRGRCAHCAKAIGWRYPAVEAAMCGLFLACAVHFGQSWNFARAVTLCFLCVVLFFTDLETMLLPDALTLPAIALGIALAAAGARPGARTAATLHSAAGAILGAIILLAIRYLYRALRGRHGMGLGDVKLLAMIGAFLGPAAVLLGFAMGTFAAALIVVVPLMRTRKTLTSAIPFGVFLCAAAVASLFFAGPILRWYLHFF